jgi:DNA-binding response OmpR family regulator
MGDTSDTPTVLVVDDEEEVADVYALRLRGEYDTRVAYGGQEALEKVDDDVDVVLLDRRMPDISGDGVLDNVRADDLDCRVVMVTAVDPDVDIIEMPFDDYLCKPVDKDTLLSAIEQQLESQAYDEGLTEYMSVAAKLGVLEAEKPTAELQDSDEYQDLKAREEVLKADLDNKVAEFDDVDQAFRGLSRN